MLTDDENIIDIQFAVQYTLKDPLDYLFNNRSPDDTVLQAAETAFREVVGASKMDFVLYEGREQVSTKAQKLIQDILDRYKTGIAISRVTMQNAQPPEQVQAAFDDAVKAKQDLERQKNEGQAYFNDVVPKARGAASRLTEEAQGYRQRVLANAEGEASRFKQVLTEYNKAPQVTRDRMYIETVQQIMSSTSKILIDAEGRRQPAVPAAGQDHADVGRRAGGRRRRHPDSRWSSRRSNPNSAARSRDALRDRQRESRPMNNRMGILLAFVLAAVALTGMTLFTVDQRERAIVFQLGEVKEVITTPGLQFQVAVHPERALLRLRAFSRWIRRTPSAISPRRRRTCWWIRS